MRNLKTSLWWSKKQSVNKNSNTKPRSPRSTMTSSLGSTSTHVSSKKCNLIPKNDLTYWHRSKICSGRRIKSARSYNGKLRQYRKDRLWKSKTKWKIRKPSNKKSTSASSKNFNQKLRTKSEMSLFTQSVPRHWKLKLVALRRAWSNRSPLRLTCA